MHARRHHWLTWIFAGCSVITFGCRGTSPLSRFVQVRQDPNAVVPDFEAPRQRLATTKPRAGSQAQIDADAYQQSLADTQDPPVRVEMTTKPASAVTDGDPRLGADSSNAAPQPTEFRTHHPDAAQVPPAAHAPLAAQANHVASTAKTASNPATAHLASDQAVTAKLADRSAIPPRTRASDKPIRSIASAPSINGTTSHKRAPLPNDSTQEELLQAFRDSPPEVKEQAIRQMGAALSRTADATTQPGSLDKALIDSLGDLPVLPAETKVPAMVPPNRLASSDAKSKVERDPASTALRSAATIATVAESRPDTSTYADVTDTAGVNESNLESTIVQAVPPSSGDRQPETTSEVRPASASREANSGSKVAQAVNDERATARHASAALEAEKFTDAALYDALLQRLSQTPADETEAERSRRLIMARHLMVLAGDPDRAVAEIQDMNEKEQEYLRHQLLGLWTIIDPDGHPVPARRFTTALPQLREATKYLAAATDSLEVRSLAFCTEIEAYGQIKTFSGNRFESGQQVILYCEIENFTVANVDAGFETHLQGSYDIFNADNEKIVSQLLPADKQVSSNYLRDYFIAYQMHLPKQLAKGSYRLQLTMEDVAGKKYGQASIPLEIK